MEIKTKKIDGKQVSELLLMQESHFLDLKSKQISPAKLTKSISAFANTAGGELYIGLEEDKKKNNFSWEGFDDYEQANGFLQCFEDVINLGTYYSLEFIEADNFDGVILHAIISKTPSVIKDSKDDIYIRRGAQSIKLTSEEQIENLRRNKGIVSFENELVGIQSLDDVTNSLTVIDFILNVVPYAEPEAWLKKTTVNN